MLYDPKWEAQTKPDVFSLESLIAWLEKQPARNVYCYQDNDRCLLGQYFTAMGFENVLVGSTDFDHGKDWDRMESFPENWNWIAQHAEWTFGAALIRAREVLADR